MTQTAPSTDPIDLAYISLSTKRDEEAKITTKDVAEAPVHAVQILSH
jgi:hypothetical protein